MRFDLLVPLGLALTLTGGREKSSSSIFGLVLAAVEAEVDEGWRRSDATGVSLAFGGAEVCLSRGRLADDDGIDMGGVIRVTPLEEAEEERPEMHGALLDDDGEVMDKRGRFL